jgi:DNA-binding PadR family transcriptional regulator
LVRDRRSGTRRIYELNPEGIALLRDHFAHLWDQALAAFQKAAEDEYGIPEGETAGLPKQHQRRQ